MTKAVRIENADNSPYELRVEVWDKGQNGAPDTRADSACFDLDLPTALGVAHVTSTRYLKIVEKTE